MADGPLADALADTLGGRLGRPDLDRLATRQAAEALWAHATGADGVRARNALWALTHLKRDADTWLCGKRGQIIDRLLAAPDTGLRRMWLSLADRLPTALSDLRADYLDFCLARIRSAEPPAVRALCLSQAYAQCRLVPELLAEWRATVALLEGEPLPPSLGAVLRRIDRDRR